MVFGLTSQGFVAKTYSDIRAEMVQKVANALNVNMQSIDQSINGVVISVYAEAAADIWELIEEIYASAYKRSASGSALDDLADNVGAERKGDTYSTVTLALSGTVGTAIPVGSRSRDAAGTKWVHLSTVILAPGITVQASPVDAGPIPAVAGSINIIDTPIAGWTNVSNPADASLGRAVASDAALRTAMTVGTRFNGGSSAETLLATLLRLPNVLECNIIENQDWITSDGMPPKSFEVVIRGGLNTDIAAAIWANAPAGIRAVGSIPATINDSQGNPHSVPFTRPTEVLIYIVCDVTVYSDFPSDGAQQIHDALLTHGQALQDGKDVIPWQFAQDVEVQGIKTLLIKVDFAAGPTNTTPLVISQRQHASIQSANITVNVLPG